MVQFTILAGGYDVFVATYLFNTLTASLTLLGKSPTGANPSWITLNPTNSSLLYAVNENNVGALQSFTINPFGSLSSPIDTIPSNGNAPAFAVGLSTGSVAVMNYNTGNGRIIPTTSQEARFDVNAPTITFPPPAGGVSHPHMAVEYKDEIFVPDLGGDVIWRLHQPSRGLPYQIQGSVPQPKGSGPRHMVIYNERIFTLHELSSTLSVQSIPPPPNGTVITYATASIIPANPPPGAVWAAAEILIPKPTAKFPIPYIYVSNRNTGVQTSTGDSIAIFEHVDQGLPTEGLKLIKQVFTGLDQIRGMEFGIPGTESEDYLVAGGVAGTAGIVMLKRVDGGRDLQIVSRNLDVPTRTSFVWLQQ